MLRRRDPSQTSAGEREPLLQHDVRSDDAPPSQTVFKVSKPTFIWILVALWSAVFLGALDATVVATLISPIGSYFQESHKASYLGTSYLLSVCCFTPLYGRLSDILGRRGAMLFGLTLFTSGTLLCGLAPSMNTLIAARAIAGMGGGGIMTVSSISLTDLVSLKHRGLFQGLANILFGLGSGIGGPLGGFINDTIGWRWAFLFQVPFLVLSMVVVAIKINIPLPSNIVVLSTYEKLLRIDWLGSLTLACGVGGLLLGLSLKTMEDIPWSSPLVWGLLVGSVVFTFLFVVVEARWSVAPVMPMRLFMQRTPMAVAFTNLFISTISFSMLYNVPLYFSAVRLTTARQSGLHLLPNSVALSLGSVLAGWYMRRTGKYYWLSITSAALVVMSNLMIVSWSDRTSAFHLWLDIVPSGLGGSSFITTSLIALIASVSKEDMAVATGISYLFRTSGQVLGVTLSGALEQAVLLGQLRERITGPNAEKLITLIRQNIEFIQTLEPPLRKAAVESYAVALRAVFISQAVFAFLTVVACLPFEENPLPASHEEQEEQDRRRRETLRSED